MASRLESIIRSRQGRLALAVTLAASGLWSFAPYLTNDVAGEAYVNAPLLRIASPIAGTVTPDLPPIGSYVAAPRTLRLVTARTLDDDPLGALLGQAAALRAGRDLARRQLDDLAGADRRLAVRVRAFEAASVRRLVAGTAAARADAAACSAEAGETETRRSRVVALAAKGFASTATVDQAEAAARTTTARCAAFAARAEMAAGETVAARTGLYLGNGTTDTPYAEQQRDRLLLRRQELTTISVDAVARLAELDLRIAAERRQIARAGSYEAELPGNSVVWQVAASPGASLSPGSTILDVADCAHRFVSVSLPERRMETIRAGQVVRIRLIGGDGWQTGRVVGTVGSAARRDVAMVAAAEPTRDGRALTVEVALPAIGPPSSASGAVRRCDIGRLAEVRFPRWSL